jgi:tetratricopeptide (TPR) repeat protein
MVRHALLFLLGVLFVGISFSSIGLALRGAPAFDETARRAGVFGDWRVPDAWALYSAPDYLFQLAFGYGQADAVASAVTEGPDEIADTRTALERAGTAKALLEESLALAPASARTWVALAWSEALLGDLAAARAALETSWDLAPWNLGLASQRVALADVLALLEPSLGDGAGWAAGMARDLETIDRFGTGPMRDLLPGN